MEKKYWFILKKSVFIWIKTDKCYFYDSDTFIGKEIVLENLEIKQFINKIADIDNLYSLPLEESNLRIKCIMKCIETLIRLDMARLIEQQPKDKKPIQLPPLLNLQTDINRLRKDNITNTIIGNEILKNLHSIHLKLDNNITASFYSLLEVFLACVKEQNFLEIEISGYSLSLDINDIFFKQLEKFSYLKRFWIELNTNTYESIKYLTNTPLTNLCFNIIIYPEDNIYLIENIVKLFTEKIYLKYCFYISSESNFITVENLIARNHIQSYQIYPLYNGENLDFFENNIYVNEQDILDSRQTKQNIFAHQVLNTNDFGKVTITTNGKVYANINHKPIGTIKDDIRYLVYKEMCEGTSWRRVRDMEPCSNCVFQWLCPSPSNYELVIGKSNLCHIKP